MREHLDISNIENIRVIRPGDGMQPKYYESLIGREVTSDIMFGTPLSLEII
jgi:sialic acid synthase SpsE